MKSKQPLCPHCRKPAAPRADNEFFPFCSKRCRLIDLGAWLTEEYRVPGPPAEQADENPGDPREKSDDPSILH